MARKEKAGCWNIPDYCGFSRGKIYVSGVMYRGAFYRLCNPLTDGDKEKLLSRHDNVKLFFSKAQYAPEIVHNMIFVADKNIKERVTA